MLRGEVWWVNFDPSIGGETKKVRPAVIVSNNSANRHLNRLQVVPLTSNTGRLYSSEAVVSIAGQQSKAMADQLTTVDKSRLLDKLCSLSITEMNNIQKAIKLQMDLT